MVIYSRYIKLSMILCGTLSTLHQTDINNESENAENSIRQQRRLLFLSQAYPLVLA